MWGENNLLFQLAFSAVFKSELLQIIQERIGRAPDVGEMNSRGRTDSGSKLFGSNSAGF